MNDKMSDLRGYIGLLRRKGELKTVTRQVSTKYEIAAVTARADNIAAVLFQDVRGSDFAVVSNLVGSRSRFAMAVGCGMDDIHRHVMSAARRARRPKTVQNGKFLQNSSTDLSLLPVVTHFEKESGPFITSSIIHVRNPDTGRQNSSFHRLMPIDRSHFSVRMVEGRHLHRCFVEAKRHAEDLRVAITVGVHPAVSVAGAYQAEWGVDELGMANALLGGGLELARLPFSGLSVPSQAEIVMEGRILHDRTHPEWMVEMLQTYDYERLQPVFELERLYYRNNPVFHDILSGYAEHRLLMGMPIESKLDGELKKAFPQTRQVSMTGGGCNWLHAVVQIKKRDESDGRHVMGKAFELHRSLKQVTVVDEDIDPNDADAVEYAMATRFQADRDLLILKKTRGSSLDPSSDQKKLRTAKMGIDATKSLLKRPEGFELARIPGIEKVNLDSY